MVFLYQILELSLYGKLQMKIVFNWRKIIVYLEQYHFSILLQYSHFELAFISLLSILLILVHFL